MWASDVLGGLLGNQSSFNWRRPPYLAPFTTYIGTKYVMYITIVGAYATQREPGLPGTHSAPVLLQHARGAYTLGTLEGSGNMETKAFQVRVF